MDKLYLIFKERTLKVIPSYVRKLIHSIIQIKKDFTSAYLDDAMLVRKAFELVAQNSYGDLYKKVVGRMERDVKWEAYVGSIKDIFSEMTNNCLYDNVSEETIQKLYKWVLDVKKTPVVVNDCPGFLVNRILAPFLNEAAYLV